MALTILITLSVISLILFIVGLVGDLMDSFGGAGLVGLIFIGLFGWGMYGNCADQTKITEPAEHCTITKSKTTVFVEDANRKITHFNLHEDYNSINDSSDFYYEINLNLYGGENNRTLKYKNK